MFTSPVYEMMSCTLSSHGLQPSKQSKETQSETTQSFSSNRLTIWTVLDKNPSVHHVKVDEAERTQAADLSIRDHSLAAGHNMQSYIQTNTKHSLYTDFTGSDIYNQK